MTNALNPFFCVKAIYSIVCKKTLLLSCGVISVLRFLLKKSERRILSSSDSVPSSSLRTCLRSWFRTSRRSCSSFKWRKGFSVMRSTVLLKQQYFLAPMLCRPNLEITTKRCTSLDTSIQSVWSPKGEGIDWHSLSFFYILIWLLVKCKEFYLKAHLFGWVFLIELYIIGVFPYFISTYHVWVCFCFCLGWLERKYSFVVSFYFLNTAAMLVTVAIWMSPL